MGEGRGLARLDLHLCTVGGEEPLRSHMPSVSAPAVPAQALFTACKMKVFDLLRDEGPLSTVDIARKIDASECGTGHLLDICVAFGLLDKTDRGKGTGRCFAENLKRQKQVTE